MSEWGIIDRIGEAAMWEQLSEECSELAQAALKAARALRRENPTPVTIMDARKMAREEFSDVCQCAEELVLEADYGQMKANKARFAKRWDAAHG